MFGGKVYPVARIIRYNFTCCIQIEYLDFVIERLSGISGKITNKTPVAITHRFNRILKEAEIPHFRFHDLRHYAVSILHAMNIPDKYIMAVGKQTIQ